MSITVEGTAGAEEKLFRYPSDVLLPQAAMALALRFNREPMGAYGMRDYLYETTEGLLLFSWQTMYKTAESALKTGIVQKQPTGKSVSKFSRYKYRLADDEGVMYAKDIESRCRKLFVGREPFSLETVREVARVRTGIGLLMDCVGGGQIKGISMKNLNNYRYSNRDSAEPKPSYINLLREVSFLERTGLARTTQSQTEGGRMSVLTEKGQAFVLQARKIVGKLLDSANRADMLGPNAKAAV